MLPTFIRRNPRSSAALAFGCSTGLLVHFAWHADVRMSGKVPALTLAAGLAHALAGAFMGPRLLDPKRTPTPPHAALTGAATSLLALAFFTPAMAAYVSSSNTGPLSVQGYVMLTLFTGLFTFLGAGWALLLVSVGVALGLHRLTRAA